MMMGPEARSFWEGATWLVVLACLVAVVAFGISWADMYLTEEFVHEHEHKNHDHPHFHPHSHPLGAATNG